MLIGITKVLIIFPFIPFLVFILTSGEFKLAYMYSAPIVILANAIILKYYFNLIFALVLTIGFIIMVLVMSKNKDPKKRLKKFSRISSWLGFRIYFVLVIIGTILEMIK